MKRTALIIFAFISLKLMAQPLTVREVFDLYPGDKYSYHFGVPFGPEQFNFIKVLNRENFGNDTLKITYFRAVWKYVSLVGYERFTDTFTSIYHHLDNKIFQDFPKRDTIIYYLDSTEFPRIIRKDSTYTDSCSRRYNFRMDEDYTGLSGTYIDDSFAVEGIGVFQYNFSDPAGGYVYGHTDRLNYYSKASGETCGVPSKYPLSVMEHTKQSLRFYPNPAVSYIQIESVEDAYFSIYNLSGQKIDDGKITDGKIDVSTLPAGQYILYILSEDHVESAVFVKS